MVAEKRRAYHREDRSRRSGEARSKDGRALTSRDRAQRGRGAQRCAPSQHREANASSGNFIEGRRAASEALRGGFPVKRALMAEGAPDAAIMADIRDRLVGKGVPIEIVSRTRLDELSSHGAHQGVMLETDRFPYADLADVISAAGPVDRPALVVVLDHVTDAGNFGAIVRSAEVVGAAGVVIPSKRAAEVTVATYKTSAGAVMHLPIARVPNIARALEELKRAGFWIGGATEHATGICWDAPFEGRVALVMGSEGDGISRLVLDTCDFTTKLPQFGRTESLNVAQATTALCFEWLRRNHSVLADTRPTAGE